ncbi:carbohydrate esterase family 16 protein [Athelia psychrophila]|uniref:Carbohydrate esterase family 16 protein n=1 Tax=Athelia psychrophila TaxID=1759441 RepID=A0A166IF38_9AGAM|nr:carbohydrate esterase family 16 protein [Fibularhizoctonia sp. CBS 109695]
MSAISANVKMLSLTVLLTALALYPTQGILASAIVQPPGTSEVKYWFSFGDSYTTTGFVNTSTLPTESDPLGNPAYPGITVGDGGPNWVDVNTVVYNESLLLTYNYAYNGAVIDGSLVTPYLPTVATLVDQVEEFLSGAGQKPASSPWTSENAFFSIWIGINDIAHTYTNSGSRSAFSDVLLDAEFALVEKLCVNSNAGARNFLWNNVPPVYRTPEMIATNATAQAENKAVILGFNKKLSAKIAEFKATHPDIRTHFWDAYTVFTTILDNPTKYGFTTDGTAFGAVGDIWGNNYHPSTALYNIIGKDIASSLKSTVWW